nr:MULTISPECIES: transposase [unclassified Streptomyces]
MLSRDGRPTPLGDAIAHYGRIAKTLHILRLADEPATAARSRAGQPPGRPARARPEGGRGEFPRGRARPATHTLVAFIDERRDAVGRC